MAHSSIRNHLKLFALADALEVSKATALGHLELFWQSVYDAPGIGIDGRLTGWTAKHIDRMAEWTGNGSFAKAAERAGFLERDGEVSIVHDYADWAPTYVKKRIDRRTDSTKDSTRTPSGKPRGRWTDSTRTPTQPKVTQPKATQPKPKPNDAKQNKPTPGNPTPPSAATTSASGGNGVLHTSATATAGNGNAIPPMGFERTFAQLIGTALNLDGVTLETERRFLETMGMRFIGLPDYRDKANETLNLAKAKVQAVKKGKLDRAFGAWRDDMETKFAAWELEAEVDRQPVEVA